MEQPGNPYTPPHSKELATKLLLPGETQAIKQRRLAVVLFSFAVGVSVLFTMLDEMLGQQRIGPWPVVYATAILSVLSSFITKDRLFAPLSCFGSIMICALAASLTHGLQYAQLHVTLPIACAFSAPSLIISAWLGKASEP